MVTYQAFQYIDQGFESHSHHFLKGTGQDLLMGNAFNFFVKLRCLEDNVKEDNVVESACSEDNPNRERV